MANEHIYIAGRYNKYLRNLSQTPWIDKDDERIKNSVQELIEEGLYKHLSFTHCVFSSSGREDVDVRMLGTGRPFVFKLVAPIHETITPENVKLAQNHINKQHFGRIAVRDLQIVSKADVSNNIKEGEESKKKEYRALCCCSKKLTEQDLSTINSTENLVIHQNTPIRVLHRRSALVRDRTIFSMKVENLIINEFTNINPDYLEKVFVLRLLTEAGTYIKEFVHGDFDRTQPNLASLIGDCETDLLELDVEEIYLDWPPPVKPSINLNSDINSVGQEMDLSDVNLEVLYNEAMGAMKKAENYPRGDERQDLYIKARRMFDQCQQLVESLNLFSMNETIDDIATNDLKYLLIPAYLSKIILASECGPDRLDTFTRAEKYIMSYFERLISYDFMARDIEKILNKEVSSEPSLAMPTRDQTIERYKKMKMFQIEFEKLEDRIKSGTVDDEVLREYYIKTIDKWTTETLESLQRVVKPAIFFEKNRSLLPEKASTSKPSKIASEPLTIVKDSMQKQVFGLGYPSRPTVTVDEFITKKINDGDLAFHAQKEIYANSLQRYAEQPTLLRDQEEVELTEREAAEEREDQNELSRKRHWDEFKEDNPRGSGNRYNMG